MPKWGYNPPPPPLVWGHLRKIGVTCAKNTRNMREDTRNIHEEYAHHT